MNLQRDYDLRIAMNASRARIEHDVQPRNAV
jgi:plasmid maintenance system antidote protein VapI